MDRLKELISEEHIYYNEPMSKHSTFRVGGNADIFVTPDEDELVALMEYARSEALAVTVLGNGSNILVADSGIRGITVAIGEPMSDIFVMGDNVSAQAGALLSRTASVAAGSSLRGMEFASGIPGSVGGAVMMNAGAYDGEMRDVISTVRILDPKGSIRTLLNDELDFSYRHSALMDEDLKGSIVLSADFALERGNKEEIASYTKELNTRRKEKQPLEYASAGSTFKRPPGMFAGKLIQDAGLKGYRKGNAGVSEKHSGFVINYGGASAGEIKEVIDHVIAGVKEQSDVTLEPEVRFIGDFDE